MTVVRRFVPEVRLKRLLAGQGGIRAEEALAGADRQLNEIRSACLAGIDTKIEQVSRLSIEGGDAALEGCYMASNEIFAEAGVFGLTELSAVAHSLCSLLSVTDRTKVPAAAVKVHVDAMRVLRTPSVAQHQQMRQAVLSELQGLARRFAAGSAA
jgi:hypothetical protein